MGRLALPCFRVSPSPGEWRQARGLVAECSASTCAPPCAEQHSKSLRTAARSTVGPHRCQSRSSTFPDAIESSESAARIPVSSTHTATQAPSCCLIHSRRASSMRVCHPRPPSLKWSITSRERRMVVDTLGLATGDRPRRTVALANLSGQPSAERSGASSPPKPWCREFLLSFICFPHADDAASVIVQVAGGYQNPACIISPYDTPPTSGYREERLA